MISKEDAQNHACEGSELPDKTSEKALHDEEYQGGNDDKIQQVHGGFLSEAPSRRQGNWSLMAVDGERKMWHVSSILKLS